MKTVRSGLLIILAMGLLIGAWQSAAGASPLKNINQICRIYYDNANGWKQVLPDGTVQPFALKPGQSFVMTILSVRQYADTPNTGPYRLLLKAPNGTIMWVEPLDNVTYPGSSTVYGGAKMDSFDPGIAMSALPTLEVRQMPVPPNNPNNGPVVPGTFYDFFLGYTVP